MADAEVQSPPPVAAVEEKPQPERKIIATAVQGTVKWFNVRNGYGFINRNDTKEDVFVHQTAIKKNNPRKFLRSVGDGEVVEFDVIEATKGSEAANVTGPGGISVKGSRYAPNKRRFRRRFFPRGSRPDDQEKPADGQGTDDQMANAGDLSEDSGTQRLPQRRRRPRRPPQSIENGEVGEQRDGVAEGSQTRQPRQRSWRPYRRPFRPRQSTGQSEDQKSSTPGEGKEDRVVKPAEAPEGSQTNGDTTEEQGQKQRRTSRRRSQRNSETSKNDTEKSAEPSSPPQTSQDTEPTSPSKKPQTSPKQSPEAPQSPEVLGLED